MEDKKYTMGIDVGGSYIKAILMRYAGDRSEILERATEKIRKRNPSHLAQEMIGTVLAKSGILQSDLVYLASTGEGELVEKKTGHFYGMTTHARGAKFLFPGCQTVIDMGALYARAIRTDSTGRVMDYKMTGQCASGSGQFIENISRYLGLALEEIGSVSLQSRNPELPSGICAVLAETDVINMVSRGISTPDIIKGIHLSVASRVVRLLTSLKAESPVALTGGLAMNKGMVEALRELLMEEKKTTQVGILSSPDSIYAGAIGAALWGGFRYEKLKQKSGSVLFQ